MKSTIPNNEPDERVLEAMLYVLRDPSLDCEAFEARMSDDPLLAEAVSHAVSLVFDVKSQNKITLECLSPAKPSIAKAPVSVAMPRLVFDSAWVTLATISAVVSLFLLSIDDSTKNGSTEPMLEVAAAWTDLQSTNAELKNADLKTGTLHFSQSEVDDSFHGLEPKNLDNDLPDWMLLAAIASDTMNKEMVQ